MSELGGGVRYEQREGDRRHEGGAREGGTGQTSGDLDDRQVEEARVRLDHVLPVGILLPDELAGDAGPAARGLLPAFDRFGIGGRRDRGVYSEGHAVPVLTREGEGAKTP